MITAGFVRRWYRIHKWSSLICTGFLLMSCITGLPLIFQEEIDGMTSHVHPSSASATASYAPADPMVATAHALYPQETITSVGWDDDEPRFFVSIAPDFKPTTREQHTISFDAHTGKRLEEVKDERGFMYVMTMLHIELFAGLPGELFLGVMALLFVVALVSGALVYGPFMRRLAFGTVRSTTVRRVRWSDLHNLIGIVTMTWGLVVGATGALNTLSGPLFASWRAQAIPALLTPYQGKPLPHTYGSLQEAVQKVHVAAPTADVVSVLFPNDVFGSPRHYLVWTHGKSDITSRIFTPYLVDVETGKIATAAPLPWYVRVLELSRPFHFGDYGGLPLKIIWAVFDLGLILVLGSGVYLWLSRRRTPIQKELDRLVREEQRIAVAAL
jgi:uncharacterized iron-regulated membrane protein